ncbi:MAG TPA: flavodoxin family protein [Candidatus Bathyarchaeia archaeon]|nr:flavodoxin family protein [Candidatus Bathyarchaeia archaeon]
MKSALVCISTHNGNTDKIANAMADALGAPVLRPEKAAIQSLAEYDLIGFGSGIYFMKHHKKLLSFIGKLPIMKNKKAFIFSTAGVSDRGIEKNLSKNHRALRNKLTDKGFEIIGDFSCCGYMKRGWYYLKGSRNTGRPNEEDLKRAWQFADGLKKKTND